MEECPVCTLYLRPGVSLREHLETHTKDLMIQALLKKTEAVQTVSTTTTTTTQGAMSRFPPQMTTTAVTYQQILTTNSAGAVVPQVFQVPMVSGFSPTMFNPLYNPYMAQPYRFHGAASTSTSPSTAIKPAPSDRDDDAKSEIMDMSDSSRSMATISPLPTPPPRSPSISGSSCISSLLPENEIDEKPVDLMDKEPAINLSIHDRNQPKDENIKPDMDIDIVESGPRTLYRDLSEPSSSKTIIDLDDGLRIFFRNTNDSVKPPSPSPLNIAADESMPARGELSEQESLGADSAWHLYEQQELKHVPWQSDNRKPFKCSLCNDAFSNAKDRRIHKLTNHSRSCKTFKCLECNVEFKTVRERRIHMTEHDVKKEGSVNSDDVTSTIHQCPTCNAAFDILKDLRIHQREIHGEIRFKCEECDKFFDEELDYSDHLKIHPLKCHVCGKLFYKRVNLGLHMKRHLPTKPFECNQCPKAFITRQKLEEHINGHKGTKPIKCIQCDKTFSRHSNLIQHKNMHHPKTKKTIRDFVCHCGEVYQSLRKLEWHKEIHDVKPKSCPFCAQKFIHSASVTRHVRRSHIPNYLPDSSKREFENVSCPICDRVCLRSSLSVHLRTHNGERPFQCTICSKQFTTKWNMELHQWTHQSRNAMPFKCNQCKSAFFREGDYSAHMNAHKNLKPFICNICGQKFIRKYNCLRHQEEHRRNKKFTCSIAGCNRSFHRSYYLKDHMKIHTGVRPHTCHICGKSSSTKSNHNKHVRIHDTRELVNTEN